MKADAGLYPILVTTAAFTELELSAPILETAFAFVRSKPNNDAENLFAFITPLAMPIWIQLVILSSLFFIA